jgi:hypothetical protein
MGAKRCLRVAGRVFPNIFVFGVGGFMFVATEFIVIPGLFQTHPAGRPAWAVFWLAVFGTFSLWAISWTKLIATDPGRTADDLERRGILHRVLIGDIPARLQHLRLCSQCHLPRPPGAIHCDVCDVCHLRADHHCAVTGQCVADRNFKFFALSFLWGGVSTLLMFCPTLICLLDRLDVIPIMNGAYSLSLAIILLIAGTSFVWQSYRDTQTTFKCEGKPLTRKKYFGALGKTCCEKVMPFHAAGTSLGWPGVDWAGDDLALL